MDPYVLGDFRKPQGSKKTTWQGGWLFLGHETGHEGRHVSTRKLRYAWHRARGAGHRVAAMLLTEAVMAATPTVEGARH